MTDPMEDLDAELQRRAYAQGYNLGVGGHAAHAGDWEKPYRAGYLNGFDAGKLERAKAQGERP